MKTFLNVLILAIVAMTMIAFSTPGHADERKVLLQIEGMVCIV